MSKQVFTPLFIQIIFITSCLPFLGQAFVPNYSKNVIAKQASMDAPIGRDIVIQRNSNVIGITSSSSRTTKSLSSSLPGSFATKFEELQSLESRLEVLERSAPSALTSFYEPGLKSFSIKPGSVDRMSITSTCYALTAVLAANEESLYDSEINLDLSPFVDDDEDEENSGDKIQARAVVQELLKAEWRVDDLFQVPLLLNTILKVDASRSVIGEDIQKDLAPKVRELVEAVLEARPQRRAGANQQYSDYIGYLCCQAYATLYESTEVPSAPDSDLLNKKAGLGGLPTKVIPKGAASRLSLALTRSAEISFNELCRQLAYRAADERSSFDVIRLAYSLLSYVTASNSLAGTAGRELVPGEGPSPGSRVSLPNRKLIKAALDAFFSEQKDDGLWDKGQPIYKSFRRSGRNVGNAFVFAADTLGCLLSKLPAESFRPHLDKLEKTLQWIESHQLVEVIPDYCDAESGQCYGKALRGWSSPHLTEDTGPLSWSTAQTLRCVSEMRRVVRALQNVDVLAEFKGLKNMEKTPQMAAWDRLLDTDLGAVGPKTRTLKEVLEERVIVPFEYSSSNPGFGAAYSVILFGPPGTAKTTICEALAERMGWDFLVIDTTAFLADGLTNVASRIRYVFERLQSLERCVILFDEIEEFCLDRETPGLGMESRMLTTAMLTAINDLRRAKRSVFFLATNRLRAFDSAVIRPGRFDMQLFVGTPNLEAKVLQLRTKMASMPISKETKKRTEEKFRSFLESAWEKDAMFMNYLEGIQFATTCANIVATQGEEGLTEEAMSVILDTQAAVMTARGAVREEYLASMDMSRL
ncbi:unnamed protein product [Cylindrotheca closterium]|uniref:AAA+ ATPase domain-containing protein n=1 Tax=Cylindrotheca closterium TaxID=2856 RepID=A0AAD2FSS2_9STRA|nr:unnamed protein product [Cylindrotheca closterium]